jgi:hypothetical protein
MSQIAAWELLFSSPHFKYHSSIGNGRLIPGRRPCQRLRHAPSRHAGRTGPVDGAIGMQLLPDPEVEPASPISPEPETPPTLLVQVLIARILLETHVDHRGILASQVALLAMNREAAVTEAAAQWAIYKLLETGALRLVYNKPHGNAYWAGRLGDPPPKRVMTVPFVDQVVAPNPDLETWLPDYMPPTSLSAAKAVRQQQERELIEQGKAIGRHERNAKPRNTERDDQIVRLHDEEGKSFGIIGRLLAELNPAWVGKNGKPLSRAAATKAYNRRKADGDK